MELKELENRIVEMDWGSIYNLNPSDLSKLTDNFSEPLVRLLFSKSRVIGAQRELFKFIKKSYSLYQKRVNLLWRENSPMFGRYPDYFDSIEANLECNRIITKNGSTSIEFKQYVSDISAVFRQNIPDNKSQKEIIEQENDECKQLLKTIDTLKKQIESLSKEKMTLEEKLKTWEDDQEELSEEIKFADKVRLKLLLMLIRKDGANLENYGNKKKAAFIMHKIADLPITTCKNFCSDDTLNKTYHDEEILKLNSKLQDLGMDIRL